MEVQLSKMGQVYEMVTKKCTQYYLCAQAKLGTYL